MRPALFCRIKNNKNKNKTQNTKIYRAFVGTGTGARRPDPPVVILLVRARPRAVMAHRVQGSRRVSRLRPLNPITARIGRRIGRLRHT